MIKELIAIVAIIVILVALINVGIIVAGMVTGADEIYCDWILCSIKHTERSAECYLNGELVPCEEFEEVIGNASNQLFSDRDTIISFV